MGSIIAQLFKGELYPSEHILPDGHAYRKARADRYKYLGRLERSLSKKHVKLLDRMMDADAETVLLENEAYFAAGMRFGIQLMRELFPVEKPEWAGNEWPDE